MLREPLPWREESMTECGRPVNDVGGCITRDQLKQRIKEYGQQRTAFTVCMTCWNTGSRHQPWDIAPASMIWREANRTGRSLGERHVGTPKPEHYQLTHELHAAAKLIEAHREEFDELLRMQREGYAWRLRVAKRKRTQ